MTLCPHSGQTATINSRAWRTPRSRSGSRANPSPDMLAMFDHGCVLIVSKMYESTTMEYVLKTTHFINSHFADTVVQSEQSIVTVDQSVLSIESAECEYTKCVVFSTCSYA